MFEAAAPELAAQWNEAGDLPERLSRLQDVAAGALGGIEDAMLRDDFTVSFEGLSEGTQAAVYSQLSKPEMAYVRIADAEEYEDFAESEVGDALISAWGPDSHNASHNIGVVIARFATLLDNLNPSQTQEFEYWRGATTAAEKIAA
ncbi:MAG: hypothetical protein HOJ07_06155, partial [Rhodospirillaceae bacterium]|nr:hypothetical protein [Rhodospirillaceae bacterium]